MSDVRQIGLALKLYAGDHAEKLPDSLDALFPVYLSNRDILKHTLLTVPGMDLTTLPENCIIAIRTIPENVNWVAVVYPDLSAKELRIAYELSARVSETKTPRSKLLVFFGILGWLSFIFLWFKYRLHLKHA